MCVVVYIVCGVHQWLLMSMHEEVLHVSVFYKDIHINYNSLIHVSKSIYV